MTSSKQLWAQAVLSDSERLNYLKACIKGDEPKIISSLRITDVNYLFAWRLLKDRSDNTRGIVQAQLQAIRSQSSMKVEFGSGLKELHETTYENLRALEALGHRGINGVLYWFSALPTSSMQSHGINGNSNILATCPCLG